MFEYSFPLHPVLNILDFYFKKAYNKCMSKSMRLSKNSALYFRWDQSNYIYLISEGTVLLSSELNNSKIQQKHQKGEFVGLYAALGNFPYQEDAITETDVEVMLFTVEEFEKLISTKSSLSLQLLQLLSKELRKSHKQAKEILTEKKGKVNEVEGLLSYAQVYMRNYEYAKAKHVIDTFLRMYPNHSEAMAKEIEDMKNKIEAAV